MKHYIYKNKNVEPYMTFNNMVIKVTHFALFDFYEVHNLEIIDSFLSGSKLFVNNAENARFAGNFYFHLLVNFFNFK